MDKVFMFVIEKEKDNMFVIEKEKDNMYCIQSIAFITLFSVIYIKTLYIA